VQSVEGEGESVDAALAASAAEAASGGGGAAMEREERSREEARWFFLACVRPMKPDLVPHKISKDLLYTFYAIAECYELRPMLPEFADEFAEIQALIQECLKAARIDEARDKAERQRLWEARMSTLHSVASSLLEWLVPGGGGDREPVQRQERHHAKVE
jgi:hypothetical protein